MMIDQQYILSNDGYWNYIEQADYVRPDNWDEHGGKFMVFGDEFQITFLYQRLTFYDEIHVMKYAPPSVEMGYKKWALQVYCLDSERDSVWGIMQKEGVTRKIWKYDKQSVEDWKPQGRLNKKYKLGRTK